MYLSEHCPYQYGGGGGGGGGGMAGPGPDWPCSYDGMPLLHRGGQAGAHYSYDELTAAAAAAAREAVYKGKTCRNKGTVFYSVMYSVRHRHTARRTTTYML